MSLELRPIESAMIFINAVVRKKPKVERQRDYGHHESFKPRLNGQQGHIHRIDEIRRQLEEL